MELFLIIMMLMMLWKLWDIGGDLTAIRMSMPNGSEVALTTIEGSLSEIESNTNSNIDIKSKLEDIEQALEKMVDSLEAIAANTDRDV